MALTWKHGTIVVGDPTTEPVQAALNAGAGGYLFEHPPTPPQPLTPPGQHATHRSDTTSAIDEPGSPDHADQPAPSPQTFTVLDTKGQPCTLSRREIEILQHVADGETNTRIARSLGVSPHNIKSHLRRTGHRLTTNDRTQMMLLAMRAGAVK
ncbi:MAG: response regulator transcription factor [Pseudonocardiales bacterium]|nr:response regulator transcription factor [Pseudonocardiales bacterium]